MNITDKDAQRFWKKVDKSGGADACWDWKAGTDDSGYGRFLLDMKNSRANRISWELSFGEIPDGMFVLHKCDRPICVNPAHLFLGTNRDNMEDMARKGRSPHRFGDESPHHKLSDAQILDIRQRYSCGTDTQRNIAKETGVSFQQIWRIINRKNRP